MTPAARHRGSPRGESRGESSGGSRGRSQGRSQGRSRGRTRGALEIAISREPGSRAPTSSVVTRAVGFVLRSERVTRATVSVTFVTNAAIRRLNARHLGKRRVTDVIAFTLSGQADRVIGDVYVAPDMARKAAAELGIAPREEILRLVVHGVLHVLGYDHPEGEGRLRSAMWVRQEVILRGVLASIA